MPDGRRTRTPTLTAVSDAAPTRRVWTLTEVEALGVTTDVVTAGQILGLSRNNAYTLVRRGDFPVPIIKAGSRYRIPVAALLAVLQPAVLQPAVTPPAGGDDASDRHEPAQPGI